MNIIYTDGTLNLEKLTRSKAVDENYKQELEAIANSGSTPSQVMLDKLFKGENEYALVYNDYPYNLDDDQEHLVLWVKSNTNVYLTEVKGFHILHMVDKQVEIFNSDRLVAIFKNDKSKKSVTDLEHYHIIVRK